MVASSITIAASLYELALISCRQADSLRPVDSGLRHTRAYAQTCACHRYADSFTEMRNFPTIKDEHDVKNFTNVSH